MNKTIRKTCYLLLIAVMALAFCGAAAVAVFAAGTESTAENVQSLIEALADKDDFKVSDETQLSALKSAQQAFDTLSEEEQAKVANKDKLEELAHIAENSGDEWLTWYHGSMDPTYFTSPKGDGYIHADKAANTAEIKAVSRKCGAAHFPSSSDLKPWYYGGAYFLPGTYYGDMEISFDYSYKTLGEGGRFFYVLAYADVVDGKLYGVGTNVRTIDHDGAAFVCPKSDGTMQDYNYSSVSGSTHKKTTEGETYHFDMKIVGTKMTVTVTAEGGEVYKNATLDYAEHFGSTAPAKREGGVVIGVNEQIVSFSNFEVKDGKDQYFADQVSGLISALPESEEIVFGDKAQIEAARAAYEALTEGQKVLVENLEKLTAAEKALKEIEDAQLTPEEQEQVNKVVELIGAIKSPVTLEEENAISAARSAYDKLASKQTAAVTNYDVLLQAEADLFAAAMNEMPDKDAFRVSENADMAVYETAARIYGNTPEAAKDKVAAGLLESFEAFEKIVKNSGGKYLTWFDGSIDASEHVTSSDSGYIKVNESEKSVEIRMLDRDSNAGISSNTKDEYYAQAYFLPGNYAGDLEISFDYVSTKVKTGGRFFYVLAYANVVDGKLYGVGTNVRTFENAGAAFVCPTSDKNMQDTNYTDKKVNGTSITTVAGTKYHFFMIIKGTTVSVTVTDMSGKVYKQATADYKTLFGDTAPEKREGGIVIGVNECQVKFSNFKIATGDEIYANEVVNLINALPAEEDLTLEDKAAVEAARSAYDALTEEQKAFVSNLADLEAAEKKIAALEKEEADKEQAEIDAVEALIEALGKKAELSDEYKKKLDDAQAAYDAMTEEQKAKVENYSELTARKSEYETLKTEQEESDERVAEVIALIDALPSASVIAAEDEADIEAAKAAYEKLSEEEKAKVTNYDKLTAAIAALDGIKNPEPAPEPEKEGCNGCKSDAAADVVICAVVAFAAASVLIVLKKRKN